MSDIGNAVFQDNLPTKLSFFYSLKEEQKVNRSLIDHVNEKTYNSNVRIDFVPGPRVSQRSDQPFYPFLFVFHRYVIRSVPRLFPKLTVSCYLCHSHLIIYYKLALLWTKTF